MKTQEEETFGMSYYWQGQKVHLRPVCADDWKAFYEDCLDSPGRQLLQCGIELPKSEDMARSSVERWVNFKDDRIMFTIETLKGESVGAVNLCSMDQKNGVFSFGIRVYRRHQGQGYGTEALRMILRYAFSELRFQKCNSSCMACNEGSKRLHEGVGFQKEGLRRRTFYTDGTYYDDVLYGMTKEEFAENENR